MRIERKIAFALTALLAVAPVAAGEEQKCDSEMTACLKYIVENLQGKGWLGVELNYPEGESPQIIKVIPESPAESAGLRTGDFLVALNGVRYASTPDEAAKEAKKSLIPNNPVTVTLSRDGREMDVEIVAGKVPQSVLAQWIGNHMLYQHRHQIAAVEAD